MVRAQPLSPTLPHVSPGYNPESSRKYYTHPEASVRILILVLMTPYDVLCNFRLDRVDLTSSPPLNSSPTSSAGEHSRTSKFSHSLQDAKEHCAHPTCPDTLCCLPDTDGRPQHTLPVILRCAILGSKMKRLTIREIYAAMEEKYPYYRTAGSTWKVSRLSFPIVGTKKVIVIDCSHGPAIR